LVLRAFEQYQGSGTLLDGAAASSAGPHTAGAAADDQATLYDADALDTILLSFLHLLVGLTSKTLISWDSLYSKEALLEVLADPRLAKVLRPHVDANREADAAHSLGVLGGPRVSGYERPLVLNPADPTHNLAADVSVEQLIWLVNFGQKSLNDVQSVVMCDLRQRLLQQEMKVKQLQSKLDQQSSLMQVLLADTVSSKGSPAN
jgi:hypothetical protein